MPPAFARGEDGKACMSFIGVQASLRSGVAVSGGTEGSHLPGSRYGIQNPMTLKQTEQATGFTLAQLKAIQKQNLHSNAS